jgi:predicted  nucleic acid-binding Zn-ribbon protein
MNKPDEDYVRSWNETNGGTICLLIEYLKRCQSERDAALAEVRRLKSEIRNAEKEWEAMLEDAKEQLAAVTEERDELDHILQSTGL